jgi:hypothetical protein
LRGSLLGTSPAEAVGDQSQDVRYGGLGVGAEEGPPAIGFVHQHHPDHPRSRTPGRHERLVPLHDGLAVEYERAAEPATTLARSLGQVDPSLAVDPGSAATPGRSRFGQRPEGRVLPQAADDDDAQADHRLEEGRLGVGPVGHHPQRFAQQGEPTLGPPHPIDGHLQLGGEGRAVFGVEAGQILPADGESRQQRQGDDTPGGVGNQDREDHPDVAVDEQTAGGARGRMVVDAGPLGVRPGAWRRRIIPGEDHSVRAPQQRLEDRVE